MTQHYAKRIGFLNKREDLTHEEFVAHWSGVHAVLCQKLPKLRRYAINVIDRKTQPQISYDGFSELWFDSVEDHDAAFASPEGVVLLADAKNFAAKLTGTLVTEKRFIWPHRDEFDAS